MFSRLNPVALKRIFSSIQSGWLQFAMDGKQFIYHKKENDNILKDLEEYPKQEQ